MFLLHLIRAGNGVSSGFPMGNSFMLLELQQSAGQYGK
jgi:hypothetical protein